MLLSPGFLPPIKGSRSPAIRGHRSRRRSGYTSCVFRSLCGVMPVSSGPTLGNLETVGTPQSALHSRRQRGHMEVPGCRQEGVSRTRAKPYREEPESRMSENKRHQNAPMWREIQRTLACNVRARSFGTHEAGSEDSLTRLCYTVQLFYFQLFTL